MNEPTAFQSDVAFICDSEECNCVVMPDATGTRLLDVFKSIPVRFLAEIGMVPLW